MEQRLKQWEKRKIDFEISYNAIKNEWNARLSNSVAYLSVTSPTLEGLFDRIDAGENFRYIENY